MRSPQLLSLVGCAVVLATAASAHAFDGQLALGGGLGIGNYDEAKSVGPLASLYGAYGMSDSFDARLELSSAWLKAEADSEHAFLSSALVGCTYKLDVIQWIPWGGLAIGLHQLGGGLPGPHRDDFEFGVSGLLGFDYAWARNDGLSLVVGVHALPFTQDDSPLTPRYYAAALRYEHRWGW